MKKVLFILILVVVVLLPNSPYFRRQVSEDSGMFMYHGQKILQGSVPYRDTWEHKGPVILYVNALGLLIGGGSVWGIWLIEVAGIAFSVLLMIEVLRLDYKRIALFAVPLFLFALVFVLDGGNLTEEYYLVAQALAVYLYVYARPRNKWVRFLFLGALAAAGFFLRQNLIGVFVAIAVWEIISIKKIPSVLLMASGFVAVSCVIVVYFYLNESLPQFFDGFVRFNLVYSSSDFLSRLKTVYMGVWILAKSGMALLAIPGAILALCSRKKSKLLSFALIWLPVEVILSSISGIHAAHYYMPWLMPLIIFSVYLLSRIRLKIAAAVVLSLTIIPVGVVAFEYLPKPTVAVCQDIAWFLLPQSNFFECGTSKRQLTQYLKLATNKDNKVLIWGFGGSVNFASNRLSPTRFTYQYPLFFRGYTNPDLVNEFYRELVANPPVIIADVTSLHYRVPPLDKQHRVGWQWGVILPEMEKAFSFFDTNYKYEASLGDEGFKVYRYVQKL